MNKRIVYTSVFGNYDNVVKPKLPSGWDWKCFSEENNLPLYEDNMMNAKRFKILPHRFLSDYEISIYIDGNYIVKRDVGELVDGDGESGICVGFDGDDVLLYNDGEGWSCNIEDCKNVYS